MTSSGFAGYPIVSCNLVAFWLGLTVSAQSTSIMVDAAPHSVNRHVVERVVAYLTVPQQACARRASKALWEAVRVETMEDLLRATVLERQDPSTVDAQLVVIAMSRLGSSVSLHDALVAWSGGLAQFYDELLLRFPYAAAIGVSARLAAIRPFRSAVTTMCIVTAVASEIPTHAVESVVLEVRNSNVLVRALSPPTLVHSAAYTILCLDEATPEQLLHMLDGVPLSSLRSIRCIARSPFQGCESLQLVFLVNLPLLEQIGDDAFSGCKNLTTVVLSQLPSLRRIERDAFFRCTSLQSVSLTNLPQLESIGESNFCLCESLTKVELSQLPSLRRIREFAFDTCSSLQSISLANLPQLESIDNKAFQECERLSSMDLSVVPSLRTIKSMAFQKCPSLQSVNLTNLPRLSSIDERAFAECRRLTSVDLSGHPSPPHHRAACL